MTTQRRRLNLMNAAVALALLGSTALTSSCASTLSELPETNVPTPEKPNDKLEAFNRNRNAPVVYVKLDNDILRPVKRSPDQPLPKDFVGPFELREESLASALELVMEDRNIPMAFETPLATQRMVTVTNLQGPLDQVVEKLCSLADLYCSFEKGALVIKETETFTVSLPPFIAKSYSPFVSTLSTITGGDTSVDSLTRSLVYTASHRNHEAAVDYFERLRANTALIVYEIQIWEVQLNDGNKTGIDWDEFAFSLGDVDFDLTRDGSPAIAGNVGIGAQYTAGSVSIDTVLNFLQTQGAVKTVSQPSLTVLSGSDAKLRIGNSRDYVSEITRTVGVSTADNVSVTTDTLETGLSIEIGSAWDNGTVYGDLKIELQNLLELEEVDVGGTIIQLPSTSDRALETKLRVRPGDSVIIGGIVEERDDLEQQGLPGGKKPLFTTLKDKSAANSELVFMLKPRVVVYTENPPETAQLLHDVDDIHAEPARKKLSPVTLKSALKKKSAAQDAKSEESLAQYLEQLPADEIAP
jgi:MSHA biogenesis protein MshL